MYLVVLFSLLEALAEEAEKLLINKVENGNDRKSKLWGLLPKSFRFDRIN
jgi:hypothetical protein